MLAGIWVGVAGNPPPNRALPAEHHMAQNAFVHFNKSG
jgi:hypothetical protein